MSVFNQYKFIAAFENSHTNGYITEKIFNVFFAGCIPIYDGAPNIGKFINPQSFISLQGDINRKLQIIGRSKTMYEKIINTDKIHIVRQEYLESDLKSVMKKLNKKTDQKIFTNKVGYKYQGKTKQISELAIINIRKYYKNDYKILDKLCDLELIDKEYREQCNYYSIDDEITDLRTR